MIKKIEVFKHPYKWEIEVTFGSLQDLLDNALNDLTSSDIRIGGSFNNKMRTLRNAALFQIGVRLEVVPSVKDLFPGRPWPKADEIASVKGLAMSPWEGECWYINTFDPYLVKGLYPVKADWDGRTFIESGHFGPDKKYIEEYKLTDTWRY